MADIKWIKLDVGIFEDEKIKIILSMPEGKTMLIIWLKLLCLAGRINNSGVLMVNKTIPYTVEMLGSVFNESEQMMRLAVDTFSKLDMVELFNGALLLPNWERHQSEDRLKQIQEKSAARVAKHRANQRLVADCNATETLHVTLQKRICNADVTHSLSKNKNKNIELELRTKNKESTGAGAPAPSPIKDPKHEYGDNGWVKLTDKQHNKLINDLGQAEFERCVSYVDESAQISTNKNGWKDWNAVLRKAHREGWGVKKSWSKPISEKDNVNKVYDESRPF